MATEGFLIDRLMDYTETLHQYPAACEGTAFAHGLSESVRRVRRACPEIAEAATAAVRWVLYLRHFSGLGYVWQTDVKLFGCKRLYQALRATGLSVAGARDPRHALEMLAEGMHHLPPKQYLAMTVPEPPRRRK